MKKKSSNNSNDKGDFLSYVFGRKDVRIVLILSVLLMMCGIYLMGSLRTTVESDDTGYPPSTLLSEPQERKYVISNILKHTYACPTLPYDISIPGERTDAGSARLSATYENYYITIMESSNTALYELNSRLTTYALDTIDVPSVEWVDVISDEGYLNGYKAIYHTGMAKISSKERSFIQYGAMYEIVTDEDVNLMIYISCDDKSMLTNGKDILDSMVYMLLPHNLEIETVETESVEESVSTETVVAPQESDTESGALSDEGTGEDTSDEDSYVLENGTKVTNENGIRTYSKEYTFFMKEGSEESLYVTFAWINYEIEPISMYVETPSGRKYERDKELSRSGEWVFVIPECEEGTYTIHGESTATIVMSYYDAMDEVSWFAAYRNEDASGETLRGFKE